MLHLEHKVCRLLNVVFPPLEVLRSKLLILLKPVYDFQNKLKEKELQINN